jgi:AcrR family transcriptional regulator
VKQNTTSARIASEIRALIKSGKLAPGDRVPSAREIVRDHDVALATATRVLAMLRRDGLVRVKPGVGTIVKGERGVELSRERVVDAAIAIADDEGTAQLTMRSLARELGVATMSVYRYVRSREELIDAMADRVLSELETPAKPRRGHAVRKELEAIARAQWAGYRRHPWLAAHLSITRPQMLPRGMAVTEAILTLVDELGLGRAETLQSAVAFIGYIRGMATSLEEERHAEQDTGLSSDEWMREREGELHSHTKTFPRLMSYGTGPEIEMGLDALFERGLAHFLDGLCAKAKRPREA